MIRYLKRVFPFDAIILYINIYAKIIKRIINEFKMVIYVKKSEIKIKDNCIVIIFLKRKFL